MTRFSPSSEEFYFWLDKCSCYLGVFYDIYPVFVTVSEMMTFTCLYNAEQDHQLGLINIAGAIMINKGEQSQKTIHLMD